MQPIGQARQSGRRQADVPHPVDVHVGARLRMRRKMLRLTQQKLATAVGVTFQQVQKYERGANRIGASRLLELARILEVPVAFFFDDTDPVRAPAILSCTEAERVSMDSLDPTKQTETRELVTAFCGVADVSKRRQLLRLVRALAGQAPAPKRVKARQ